MARLEDLERKFEENPRRYFAPLANEYRKAGEPQRAVELCRAQLPEVPGHISGHIVLGQALFDARDFTAARGALETALALDPENIVALRYLGDIARELGESAEAERWYARTLEADPYNEAAMAALEAVRATAAVAEPSGERADDETANTVDGELEGTNREETPGILSGDASTGRELMSASSEISEPALTNSHSAPESRLDDPGADGRASAAADAESSGSPESVDVIEGFEPTVHESPEPATAWPSDDAVEPPAARAVPDEFTSGSAEEQATSGEFAGDLAISTEVDPSSAEQQIEEPAAESATPAELLVASVDDAPPPAPLAQPTSEDVLVGAAGDDTMQTEELVMETAAPFVTETMADLYLDQGYPHEALELLLQLSEQRPNDEELRAKIESIEAMIVARRDAAVAAARAERHDAIEAAQETFAAVQFSDDIAAPAAIDQPREPAESEHAPIEATYEAAVEPADASSDRGANEELQDDTHEAPFDPAVAQVDASAFTERDAEPFGERAGAPGFEDVESSSAHESADNSTVFEECISVREMFARMDRARPRAQGAVAANPIARVRSDFVRMPGADAEPTAPSDDDPFAFPDARPQSAPDSAPRSSGPHPTFNPSTAGLEDFDAWLRGLKEP